MFALVSCSDINSLNMFKNNNNNNEVNMNIVKNETRLKEINNLLESPDWFKSETHNLLDERNDIQFKLNSQNINFILRGQNKYYYANQCTEFTENVSKFGFGHITTDMIKRDGICFNQYSINNGYNQYCRDMKRFSSKEELIGFVIGYNQAISNFQREL